MMNYHTLGRTGFQVSEIGFGGAPMGLRDYLGKWEPESEESSRLIEQAVERAVELGINYFDTAPGYGGGLGEEMMGRVLKKYREKVYIATKSNSLEAGDVRRSVEESLKRLQTDYLDVIQFHGLWLKEDDIKQILKPGGVLAAFQQLRQEGLVRFIGFTSEGANGPASTLVNTGEFDVIQICYNLIFQHPYEPSRRGGIMFEAEDQQMGITIMRPITSGIFQKWINQVDPEIERRVDLHAALLSFILSNPLNDVAIVGMRSAKRVEANVAIANNSSLRINVNGLHERYV